MMFAGAPTNITGKDHAANSSQQSIRLNDASRCASLPKVRLAFKTVQHLVAMVTITVNTTKCKKNSRAIQIKVFLT